MLPDPFNLGKREMGDRHMGTGKIQPYYLPSYLRYKIVVATALLSSRWTNLTASSSSTSG